MTILNKYFLRFYLKHLFMQYKYLFFINYVDNKDSVKLKNKCLQLNIISFIFYANIVRSVFSNCNLGFSKSKLLVLATNEFDLVAKTNSFDLGSDFLFFCFNGIFLNLDVFKFNELKLLYNNNFLFINIYIVYYYVYLILIIYW